MMIDCRLRILMAEKRIDIITLANELGVSRHTISGLYNGRASTFNNKLLSDICEFFECGISDVLVYKPDPKKVA